MQPLQVPGFECEVDIIDMDDDEEKHNYEVIAAMLAENRRKAAAKEQSLKRKRDAELVEKIRAVGAEAETDGGLDPGSAEIINDVQRVWEQFVPWAVDGSIIEPINPKVGPRLEDVRHFTAYFYETRNYWSRAGRVGRDVEFLTKVQWTLAPHVFPRLYEEWRGLDETVLQAKAVPFGAAAGARLKRLMKQEKEPEKHGTGKLFRKKRWTDRFYYLVQDHHMALLDRNEAVTRNAIIGYMRITGSRNGSMAKSKYDLREETQWAAINVLNVKDLRFGAEGLDIVDVEEVPSGEKRVVQQPRGEVKYNRVKRRYYEYDYGKEEKKRERPTKSLLTDKAPKK